MNCDATVYTPAAITVPATERKSVQISSLPLLVTASTCSLTSLTVCFFLLLLNVGPVPFSFSFLVFCFVFCSSVFSFSHSKSGICLLACSVEHLSFLLSLVHHTFLQLLYQSLLLSSPSCALLFHERNCLLQLLSFFLPFLLHNSLGTWV